MMSNAHGRRSICAHEWSGGSLKLLQIGSTEVPQRNMVYGQPLEQQTNSANPIPQGETTGKVSELVLRQDRPSHERRATGGRQMMLSKSSYLSFTVTKMILKYQSGRKHELTNDMMKRAKVGRNSDIGKSKPV